MKGKEAQFLFGYGELLAKLSPYAEGISTAVSIYSQFFGNNNSDKKT